MVNNWDPRGDPSDPHIPLGKSHSQKWVGNSRVKQLLLQIYCFHCENNTQNKIRFISIRNNEHNGSSLPPPLSLRNLLISHNLQTYETSEIEGISIDKNSRLVDNGGTTMSNHSLKYCSCSLIPFCHSFGSRTKRS